MLGPRLGRSAADSVRGSAVAESCLAPAAAGAPAAALHAAAGAPSPPNRSHPLPLSAPRTASSVTSQPSGATVLSPPPCSPPIAHPHPPDLTQPEVVTASCCRTLYICCMGNDAALTPGSCFTSSLTSAGGRSSKSDASSCFGAEGPFSPTQELGAGMHGTPGSARPSP